MGLSIKELKSVLEVFIDKGVDFIIIGDTAVQLAAGARTLVGDLDLFVLKPSPVDNEDFFVELARENNWDYGYTELGTPKIVVKTGAGDVAVELYENIFDFNVPEEVVNEASSVTIEGLRVKILKPEHYVVLKAKQGVDLDKLKTFINELKNLDYRVIRRTLEALGEDERITVKNRLRNIGLDI